MLKSLSLMILSIQYISSYFTIKKLGVTFIDCSIKGSFCLYLWYFLLELLENWYNESKKISIVFARSFLPRVLELESWIF